MVADASSTSLSTPARDGDATSATAVYVSPVSFFEIGQKVRLGKWPTMAPVVQRLDDLLTEQGGLIAPLDRRDLPRASLRDWPHRDPFDRLLAVTCRSGIGTARRSVHRADAGLRRNGRRLRLVTVGARAR